MLDKDGGPIQGVVNQCHAPIMLDESNRICYQPSYYILEQISRTVQPGTVSIKTTTDADIAKTAVIDEAGNISVMLGNVTDAAQTVRVVDQDSAVSVTLQPHSLTPVTFRDDYRPGNGINPDLSEELVKPIHAVASTLKNPVFNYRAESAVDDNLRTRWASDWTDEERITFELLSRSNVSGVEL